MSGPSNQVLKPAQSRGKPSRMAKLGGWEAVREAVRQRIGASAYGSWFRTLEGALEDDALVIRCPDRFSRDWIHARYESLIKELAPEVRRIDYQIDSVASSLDPKPSGDRVPRARHRHRSIEWFPASTASSWERATCLRSRPRAPSLAGRRDVAVR